MPTYTKQKSSLQVEHGLNQADKYYRLEVNALNLKSQTQNVLGIPPEKTATTKDIYGRCREFCPGVFPQVKKI